VARGAPRAELGQPEINLHVIPGFGGTQMLPRLSPRRARAGGGQLFSMLSRRLAVLLDGRRRPPSARCALGVVDEVAPADALGHALAWPGASRSARFTGALWSPLADDGTLAFPNVERDPDIQRLLAHHAHVPRGGARRGHPRAGAGRLHAGPHHRLAAEAREFGRLTASADGRAGLDRFLARRSLPLPRRKDDLG
jgi:enoyl-CoA hydratase/carnithine racemase